MNSELLLVQIYQLFQILLINFQVTILWSINVEKIADDFQICRVSSQTFHTVKRQTFTPVDFEEVKRCTIKSQGN